MKNKLKVHFKTMFLIFPILLIGVSSFTMKKGCKNDFDFSRKINEGNEVETIIHFESVLSTIEAKKILIHFRQNSKILKSFYNESDTSYHIIYSKEFENLIMSEFKLFIEKNNLKIKSTTNILFDSKI